MKKGNSFLESEIISLENLLQTIPANRVIDRFGVERRLQRARQKIEELSGQVLPKRLFLTFKGAPVDGTHGISADFAGSASRHFSEAYAALMAGRSGKLRYMGPIPDRDRNRLMIVGTAQGSFGFEIEVPVIAENNSELFLDDLRQEDGIESVISILAGSLVADDEAFGDVVHRLHPRAIKKIVEFLDFVAKEDACFTVKSDMSSVEFSDTQKVKASGERLSERNIKNTEEEYEGRFEGCLPKRRLFQLQVRGEKDSIVGYLGPNIDPYFVSNNLIDKNVRVFIDVVQVGQGRPRYTANKIEEISAEL